VCARAPSASKLSNKKKKKREKEKDDSFKRNRTEEEEKKSFNFNRVKHFCGCFSRSFPTNRDVFILTFFGFRD